MRKIIVALTTAALLQTAAYAAPEQTDPAQFDNKKIAWGLGPGVDGGNRPTDAISSQKKFEELHGLFIGDADKKRLWLTFDEGYENGCTSRILDVLGEKGVRAVFFVTYDYVRDNPGLVRRMIDEGHTVGNHTYSHPSLPECSLEEMREELLKVHEFVKKEFGYDMYVMRPPKGEFSEQVLACAKQLGYTTVLWSFAYMDWVTDAQPEETAAFKKITSKTHNGAVYLLHAVSETNAAVLGSVIDYWNENGYVITPM